MLLFFPNTFLLYLSHTEQEPSLALAQRDTGVNKAQPKKGAYTDCELLAV